MNSIYEGIEPCYPDGMGGRLAWCYCYWHNGRLARSIDTYWTRDEARQAGKTHCYGVAYHAQF